MNMTPKVYVSTYAKYNNGDLTGKWIDLVKCGNYSHYISECNKVHSDEEDPEFMIQDSENMPDGLDCLEWLGEKEFNDIISAWREENSQEENQYEIIYYSEKAFAILGDTKSIKDQLKKLGGRFNPRLSCGAGWIFSKTKLDEVKQFLKCGELKLKANNAPNEENPYKTTLQEFIGLNEQDKNYYSKYYLGALKFNNKYLLIEKHQINNKFCFSDEGVGHEVYKTLTSNEELMKKHFIKENIKEIERNVELLDTERDLYFTEGHKNTIYTTCRNDYHFPKQEGDVLITPEQREEIKTALLWSKKEFEKRLQTYLKRYGVSKLHVWTYWADR